LVEGKEKCRLLKARLQGILRTEGKLQEEEA
jgi:hypothetical protein